MAEASFGQTRDTNPFRMDPFCRKKSRRLTIVTVPIWGHTDPQGVAVFRAGWNEGSHQRIQASTNRRTFHIPTLIILQKTGRDVEEEGRC